MGSIANPGGEFGELNQTPPSFDDFQRQTSLMTSCTLLWKELSDHFSSLEQNLLKKSEALKRKIRTLDTETKESLQILEKREVTIDGSVSIALGKVQESKKAALVSLEEENGAVGGGGGGGEVDDGEGLLLKLRSYSTRMDSEGFWRFVMARKKELDSMRAQMPVALADCVDPARFVLEAISEVFPVDKRPEKSEGVNDLGWACVLILESLIPVVVDPILGNSRLLVTPIMKERAKEIAETWKASLDERGGIENVKTPDVHTFLQHLVTFGIVKKEDIDLYRKLVVGSAWRKQMPKLALSLGLGDKMPDMIEELISRGQQVDAVHFTFEVGLDDKFPPVPLLKAFLKDAKKAATSILEDPNNSGRAAHLAARKEQSALRAVIKCIEEYKLEAKFPPENLRKRLEQLEKVKSEKRKPAAVPANKRTRANNGGPMPPAKAGRSTNAYVSSFPAAPTFVRSPSHTQYPAGVPMYSAAPGMYGSRSPPTNPYAYSPEAANPYAYSPEVAPPLATLFLSPPPLSKPHFPHYFNPISDPYISTSPSLNPNSFRNPKPIPPSKSAKTLSLSSTSNPAPATITANNDDADNNNINGKNRIQTPNPDCSFSSELFSRSDEAIKMPTAPWMKGPLLLHPNQFLDLSKPRKKKNSINEEEEMPDRSLTEKVSGGRGKKAMKKIFEGIGELKETHVSEETQKNAEDIEFDFPLGELGEDENSKFGGKMPWETDERVVFRRTKKEKVVTAAELRLDGEVLERLRGEAARMRRWVKVKKAGVTEAVVDQIRLIWKDNELAMLKFDLPLCRNMDRAREIVEAKTGGLVVWSKKDALVVYSGCNYQLGLKTFSKMHSGFAGGQETSSLNISHHKLKDNITLSLVKSDGSTGDEKMGRKDGEMEIILINGSLYEREADRLLDGLGPRFIDWWRPKPLPVDADLLPEVVPGFKPPFRLCPPHARAKLTDDELTYLRKHARPLPTHFVLGRNRKLQGLAAAILKLWEKCHIVKIAVKWGSPNTNNAQMAYELKYLTGGVLLLRNKFFIILYRGKDFLPCRVANVVADREMELKKCQLQEEVARLKAIETFYLTDESSVNDNTTGTLSEFEDIQSERAHVKNANRVVEVQLEAEKERIEKQLGTQERKLLILKMKIERSAKELAKLSSAWRPAEQDADQEMITQEERECFRKIGLKMDSSLVLGRRGVFDGVIEGLHQHWKHREVVKVITMQRLFTQVIYTAIHLETESGGVLVSVDKLKEGHAIIVYRGKNYRRPLNLVPQNLLNKREALCRSLEMQRIGSLKFFAYQRQLAISDMKCKLADLEKRRGTDQRE